MRDSDYRLIAMRGALRINITCEVRVREDLRLHLAAWITDPSNHSTIFGKPISNP